MAQPNNDSGPLRTVLDAHGGRLKDLTVLAPQTTRTG